jgi:site-specific DNA-methyltransferase (adenine-specific)
MTNNLILGDSLQKLKILEDNSIDSCVTDPPYELGFMNQGWDKTGIVYNIELWKEVLRVLKPGGHLLAFSGTRTYHRMTCAIEDAGFEIRDQIQWIYGQGFPKSYNISKGIDKINGKKRESILVPTKKGNRKLNKGEKSITFSTDTHAGYTDISLPISEDAQKWNGWGTALKPGNEPICIARKPITEKTVSLNVLKWGTGGLNIDGCRIELNGEIVPINKLENWSGFGEEIKPNYEQEFNNKGRFPANVIFDEESGKLLDEQSGNRSSGKSNNNAKVGEISNGITPMRRGKLISRNDSGGASRFFYCVKASKKEKNLGLIEKTEHTTVKPIDLMRYLCKLVTPKNGIVLDPFMGSGSTGIGANLEEFGFIGIEKEENFYNIAEQRIEYWNKNKILSGK